MHPSLQQALDIIIIERNAAEYTHTFAAVHSVVSVFGELDLANRLFAEIPRTVSEERVAELFNFLAWQTNDNGAAMVGLQLNKSSLRHTSNQRSHTWIFGFRLLLM